MYFKRTPTKISSSDPWYSRGYLPHFDDSNRIQSITFHLHDAVPVQVIVNWKTELQIREDRDPYDAKLMELRRRIVEYADRGYGECWLRNEEAARIMENALLHFDGQRYRLIAWCVMPNHVHVLMEQMPGYAIRKVVHSWKSYTANMINKVIGRSREFWERDYHDRFIRNEQHFHNVKSSIEQNPVKAGMVREAEHWLFSNAGRGRSAFSDLKGKER